MSVLSPMHPVVDSNVWFCHQCTRWLIVMSGFVTNTHAVFNLSTQPSMKTKNKNSILKEKILVCTIHYLAMCQEILDTWC